MDDRVEGPDPPPDLAPELTPLVGRTEGLQPWRRLFHAGSGLLLAWGPATVGMPHDLLLPLLAGVFALLLALDVARLRSTRLNALFFRSFPALASPREARGIASSTWYVLGVLLAYLLVPPAPARAAILVLALADPAASVVGRTWGRTRLGTGTVEGTGAFLVVALAVLWPVAGMAAALVTAAAVTVAEPLTGDLDDNLVIPVLGAAVLTVVGG